MRNSKKVGLVAVTNNNYGSQLQTFAMHHALNLLGAENEVIRYSQRRSEKIKRLFNPSFVSIKGKAVVRNIKCKIQHPDISKGFSVRNSAFERFKKEHISYSPIIPSREVLEEYTESYSGVVLGSDQVWHPANLEMDYFTLTFVPDSMPKITYAPSFGVSKIPEDQAEKTKAFLSRIDRISVRETAGASMVQQLIGRDVPVVCDPTALLTRDQWDAIRSTKKYTDKKYIFCYFLGSNPEHRRFAEEVKRITGFQIVALQHLDEFVKGDLEFGDITPYDVGPDDFINLLAGAELVLTDSFHGTMFSIYYHKKFFTFSRFGGNQKSSTNSRIASILEQLGLQDRWLSATENPASILQTEVNWDQVDAKLNEFREKSLTYLKNALHDFGLLKKQNPIVTVDDKEKKSCVGCTACVGICPVHAISMKRDKEGFDYPEIDENACLKCGACVRVCPVGEEKRESPIRLAMAARNYDRSVRLTSSSGGLFTSLAENTIKEGGVVVGASFDADMVLEHRFAERIEEVEPMRASKYVQSSLQGVFPKVKSQLEQGRKVLFCGTPCQAAGLKAYLRKDYPNLLLVDVLCYGVPSPGVFSDFISYLERMNQKKVASFKFRDKTYGYASPNVRVTFTDGSYKEMSYDVKSYTNLFFRGVIARPSCAVCSFKGHDRVSDITLGDYWEVGKRAATMDDDTGATLVLVHSEKGRQAISALQGIDCAEVDFETAVGDCGPMLMNSAPVSARRYGFFEQYSQMDYIDAARKYAPESIKNRLANTVKPILLKTGITKSGILKSVKRLKIKNEGK